MTLMDRIHLTITGIRLVIFATALGVLSTLVLLSVFSLNPIGFVLNMVLFDLVSGRFMQVEHQLAERDVVIDFPGRKLASDISTIYQKNVHRKKPRTLKAAQATS